MLPVTLPENINLNTKGNPLIIKKNGKNQNKWKKMYI